MEFLEQLLSCYNFQPSYIIFIFCQYGLCFPLKLHFSRILLLTTQETHTYQETVDSPRHWNKQSLELTKGTKSNIFSLKKMFHLALSLYTQYSRREQYNLLILGLDNAGKTTFLEHIKLLYPAVNESLKEKEQRVSQSSSAMEGTDEDSVKILKGKRILPTVGQNTSTVRFKSNESSVSMAHSSQYRNINLKFWDLGGQKSLRTMWSRYYRSCHGIIFIIDSTDTERFQECYETLMDIANDSSWALDGSVSVPILMLANKQDLPQAVDLVTLKTGVFIEVVSKLEATDLKLLPVSVLENHGLRDSLDWLVTRLVYNKSNRPPEYR